jgi:hypothetical protein
MKHRKCDVRCQCAKSKKCTCECGGKNHGKGSPQRDLLNYDASRVDAEAVDPRYRPKANYDIISDRSNGPLIIKDIGPWDKYMTVTNAAEFVVLELKERLPAGRQLFYWDSEGVLNELLIKDGKFAGFKYAGQVAI